LISAELARFRTLQGQKLSAKAEFISFVEPKVRVDTLRAKQNQRKGLSPTELTPGVEYAGIFRLAIHGSVGKRRTSCASPSGSSRRVAKSFAWSIKIKIKPRQAKAKPDLR
jgi:hypothetical protein